MALHHVGMGSTDRTQCICRGTGQEKMKLGEGYTCVESQGGVRMVRWQGYACVGSQGGVRMVGGGDTHVSGVRVESECEQNTLYSGTELLKNKCKIKL